jgi:hypothetical protein
LFWNCWTALTRALAHGVPWSSVTGLAEKIRQIARYGSPDLARSYTVRSIGLVGVRTAAAFDSLIRNRQENHPSAHLPR